MHKTASTAESLAMTFVCLESCKVFQPSIDIPDNKNRPKGSNVQIERLEIFLIKCVCRRASLIINGAELHLTSNVGSQ